MHNHAVGGGNREFLAAWAGRDIPVLDRTLHSMAQMHDWAGTHHGFLHATPAGRLKCIEASFVQARLDGVTRVELGDDVWSSTLFDNSALRVTEQLKHIHAVAAPDVEWIPLLGISRHCSIRAIGGWMEPYLELGVYRALDLSGDELVQPIENFKPVYRRAKQAGLRLKAHAGEWTGADAVWRAVEELELDEVQHGISAATSPAVMRLLRDNGIRLNICPTSNVMLGRVESLDKHPIRVLFDAGVRVTVNTDDCLIFGSSVSEEFLKLYRCGLFTAAELDRIRQNGLTD
ncbi:MAG TPA: hypothetical protein VNU97_14980 [Rhizomicrobium sp.]|nr:hypothetical protein [Rhizomicrobium sp.]